MRARAKAAGVHIFGIGIGGDVASSVTGDLLPVDGTIKGQQRILRRLLTNPGDYIWHPTYGAGLGAKVGDNTDIPAITALIRAQIRLESVVSQNPPPTVRVTTSNPKRA